MSYNAMIKAKHRRAGGKPDWTVGSSQASSIGIPHNLVKKVSKGTNTIVYIDGVKKDTRNLVVSQNTLSGVGRYRSQFYVDSGGAKHSRYYLDDGDVIIHHPYLGGLGTDWSFMFKSNIPDPSNAITHTILISQGIDIKTNTSFSLWGPYIEIDGVTTMASMFNLCDNLTGLGLDTWTVGSVTDMNNMFNGCSSFNGDIGSWDVADVSNMKSMFHGASIFNGDISEWDVSNVTHMNNMFRGAHAFNKDLSWNVSNVTHMNNMFQNAHAFNGNISAWNVSNVSNMTSMFGDAQVFNSDISGWDVSTVTNMASMFQTAEKFNRDLSWNVSNVTHMNNMFAGAALFDRDIGSWDVSKVIDMTSMFNDASDFNQDIGSWDISNVTAMTEMFAGSGMDNTYNISSSRTVAGWLNKKNSSASGNPSTVFASSPIGYPFGLYDFSYVFIGVDPSFAEAGQNYPASVSTYGPADRWNVSKLTDMSTGFQDASGFNEDISNWDVANVTDMNTMFGGAIDFSGNISAWDVSSVTDMDSMFASAENFNSDISGWNVSSVTDMGGMFSGATLFNRDLIWNVSNVTDMSEMFEDAIAFNGDIDSWIVSDVSNMNGMFSGALKFNRDIGSWNVSSVTDMTFMFEDTSFNGDIGNWVVSNVTSMDAMFEGASAFNRDLSWNVSNVTGMTRMFSGASSFNGDISGWNVSNVTSMISMFKDATTFNQDISGWILDPSCSIVGMFIGATALLDLNNNGFGQKISNKWYDPSGNNISAEDLSNAGLEPPIPHYWIGDLSTNWSYMFLDNSPNPANTFTYNVLVADGFPGITTGSQFTNWAPFTSSVTDMNSMFVDCSALTHPNLKTWDVSNVTNMSSMFSGAMLFDENIGSWIVSDVSNMNSMFKGALKFNGDIGSWDVSNVTDMTNMFNGATTFNKDISEWILDPSCTIVDMFIGATALLDHGSGGLGQLISNTWNEAPNNISAEDLSNAGLEPPQHHEWITGLGTDWSNMFANNVANPANTAPGVYQLLVDNSFGTITTGSNFQYWGPYSSSVTDMNKMFLHCTQLTGAGLETWDPSNVINMSNMFEGALSFDGDISGWTVSNVVLMEYMFLGAAKFNKDIGSWDVSKVCKMSAMFQNATSFNGDINGWHDNLGSMDNMVAMPSWVGLGGGGHCRYMLHGASSFNQDISGWVWAPQTWPLPHMFNGSGLSPTNNDHIWNAWITHPNNISASNLTALGLTDPNP